MSVDVIAALRAVLLADTDLAAVVGGRVFGKELPRAEADNQARAAVVLQTSGGPNLLGGYVDHTSQRVDARCYGSTPIEADQVEGLVFDAFKQLRRTVQDNVLIHWIEDAGGFTSGRDANADWPLSVRSWQVLFATTAVP